MERRYHVWCKAIMPLSGRRGFCPWKGYRKQNPMKPCPQCGGGVSAYDRETREAVTE